MQYQGKKVILDIMPKNWNKEPYFIENQSIIQDEFGFSVYLKVNILDEKTKTVIQSIYPACLYREKDKSVEVIDSFKSCSPSFFRSLKKKLSDYVMKLATNS